MRIDDWQLRFEDGLLLLVYEPGIVGLADMTKPTLLNGLRHDEFPICPDMPVFSGIRDDYRLAFDARSKALTRDSGVHARLADARQVDSATYSGGSQIPPGGKGHEARFPPPSLSAGSGGSKGDNRRNARRRARCADGLNRSRGNLWQGKGLGE